MEETDINIRWGVEGDKYAIADITNENYKILGSAILGEIKSALQGKEVLVAENNTGVIGFLIFHIRKDNGLALYSMAVRKWYRNRGIGTLLIEKLLSEAKRSGVHTINLKCPADAPANNFYQKRGFKKVGEVENVSRKGQKRKLNLWRYDVR